MIQYNGKEIEVLEAGTTLSVVKYTGEEDHKSFTVRSTELIEKKVVLTSVQRALTLDPEVLTDLLPYVVRIEISSSPAGVESVTNTISENTSLTDFEAVEYIRIVTDKSHAAKYDVIVQDTIPVELRDRSKVFFNENGHRAKTGELQIGSKSLALWLINQGVFPEKQTVMISE